MARGGNGNSKQPAVLAELGAQEIEVNSQRIILPGDVDFVYAQDADSVKQAIKVLNELPSVGFDIETAYVRGDGLHNGTISLLQIGDKENKYVFDAYSLYDPKAIKPILTLLRRKDQRHVIHRAIYEQPWMWYVYAVRIGNLFDTEEAERMLKKVEDPAVSTRLAAVLERRLGVTMSKAEQSSDWSLRPLSRSQLQYAADDIEHLNALADIQEVLLKEYDLWEEFLERMDARYAKSVESILKYQRYKDDDYQRVMAMVERSSSISELRQLYSELPTFVLAARHRAILRHQIDGRIVKRQRR